MQLIKRVLMTTVLITVLAPVINIQAAAESHEGSQVDQVNSREEEIKEAAAQSGVERTWQDLSPEEQQMMGDAFVMAVNDGNIDEVRRLFERGVPLDFPNRYGNTALGIAPLCSTNAMVKVLNELSVCTHAMDKQRLVLMQAVCHDDVDLVKTLLKPDTPIDIVDIEGRTLLMKAAYSCSNKMVDLLLSNEQIALHINDQDNRGHTALMIAIRFGNRELMKNCCRMIKESREWLIGSVDEESFKNLMISNYSQLVLDKIETVRLLLLKRADVNKVNCYGQTALYLAITSNSSMESLLARRRAMGDVYY